MPFSFSTPWENKILTKASCTRLHGQPCTTCLCQKARTLGEGNRKILVGPVETKGENLPSGKNIADYVDKRGRMDLLRFFEDHRNMFPTLWIISQCEMPNQVGEVGREGFFTISVYVSSKSRQD